MVRMRSATLFRLLCAAIGLLAIGLLAMVGFMVYPYLFGNPNEQLKSEISSKPPTVARRTETPLQVRVESMAEWLFPTQKAASGGPGDLWSSPKENFRGWRLVGMMAGSNGNGSVMLQREGDGSQFFMPMNQAVNKIELKAIRDDLALINVEGSETVLSIQKPVAARAARRGPTTRSGPTAAAPAATGGTPAAPTISATTYSSGRPSRGDRGPGQPTGTAAASTTSTQSGSGVNWSAYWAERRRRQNTQQADDQNTQQPETPQPQPPSR